MNPDHLSASFLLMCNGLWQLSGQYLTAVCVFSVKREKDYVQALLRMQSQVLWVKKCYIYSHPCSTNPFPCVSNVMLPSFDYNVTCGGFLRAPWLRQSTGMLAPILYQALQCYSFHRFTEWFRLERTLKPIWFQPPAMGTAATLQAQAGPSDLALNSSRDGAPTASLGSLCQCLTSPWEFPSTISSKSPPF